MNSYNDRVEYIRQQFQAIVTKVIPNAEVNLANFNKAIIITDSDLSFRVWIRIMEIPDYGLIIDFSSVCFPEEHRRKGLMTNLLKDSMALKNIWKVKVTSVLSQEMQNCCVKNGLTQIGDDFVWENKRIISL